MDRTANPRKDYSMSIQMNRILDTLASYAIVGLALTVAGFTAIIGA